MEAAPAVVGCGRFPPTNSRSHLPPRNHVKISEYSAFFLQSNDRRFAGTTRGKNREERGSLAGWQAEPAQINPGPAIDASPRYSQSRGYSRSKPELVESATSRPTPYHRWPDGWCACWREILPSRRAWRGGRRWQKPRGKGRRASIPKPVGIARNRTFGWRASFWTPATANRQGVPKAATRD
jgi:hypothetical protein